jgi:hypothetical protein|tara:strand:- start:126 stop:881 length:756 start_codon:yes stop_codon:yes gene_type:complete
MKSKLREHSCKIGVDYVNKIIIVSPEEGSSRIVLTTPALYAWHAYNLTTEEGITHWKLLEIGGFIKKEMVLKLLKDYVIGFVNCKEIFVYGIILSEKMNGSIYGFGDDSAKIIQGSPFLYRKSIFISHSSGDKTIVRDLTSRIDRDVDVWMDEKKITVGDSITSKINEGLSNCDAIILCLSKNSISSDWVKREYAYAIHKKLKIIPVRLDKCDIPPILFDTKYIDFINNETNCIIEILKSIELSYSMPNKI